MTLRLSFGVFQSSIWIWSQTQNNSKGIGLNTMTLVNLSCCLVLDTLLSLGACEGRSRVSQLAVYQPLKKHTDIKHTQPRKNMVEELIPVHVSQPPVSGVSSVPCCVVEEVGCGHLSPWAGTARGRLGPLVPQQPGADVYQI